MTPAVRWWAGHAAVAALCWTAAVANAITGEWALVATLVAIGVQAVVYRRVQFDAFRTGWYVGNRTPPMRRAPAPWDDLTRPPSPGMRGVWVWEERDDDDE